MKITFICLAAALGFYACGSAGEPPPGHTPTPAAATPADPKAAEEAGDVAVGPPANQTGPKTVLDFFALLPEKYFTLEGCDRGSDKDCKKARANYLKTFTEVEDIGNGYFKGGCDAAQACIEMTIIKRPDGKYLVAVATFAEMMNDFYFLDYSDGKWTDVAKRDVPEFSSLNWYELPRIGTTMKVYAKKVIEKGDTFEITERGNKLYDLVWKDGRFTKR